MKGKVLQGSALGPLLFLVHLNTLVSIITTGTLLQYADDVTLFSSGPTSTSAASTMNYQLKLLVS